MDIGRNDPCHCGSGKKYKKCCEAKDQAKEHATLEKQWNSAVATKEKEIADEEKSGEKSANPNAAIPKKAEPVKAHVQKHQSFTGPKVSMPRKSGGGGA